jgi:biopolymer transport protein ExbD
MSLHKRYNKRFEHEETDMGPLNDILFILMFFFLIISTLANPNVMKLTNPKSSTTTKTKQTLVVSVKRDGSTYIGRQPIQFDSLESYLSRMIDKKDTINKQSVVINADTAVSINQVVGIMNAAKKAGAAGASLAVDAN